MEPKSSEKQNWVTPEIDEYDMVEMTQSNPPGSYNPLDSTTSYS